MPAAFWKVAGALVGTLLCGEIFTSQSATAQTGSPTLHIVQNDSDTPSTSTVRAPAMPQHGAGEWTQDGKQRKHDGAGALKTRAPSTAGVSGRGATATVLGRRGPDSSSANLGPIYQLPHYKSESNEAASGAGMLAPSEASVGPISAVKGLATNLSARGPTGAIAAPSWTPESLETAVTSGFLSRQSATPNSSIASDSNPAATPRSNQPTNVTDTGSIVSKTANVGSNKIGEAGELVGSDSKQDKQKEGAADHAVTLSGVLTETPVETSVSPTSESNNESKIATEIPPSMSITPRSNQAQTQSEAVQPSSAVEQGWPRNESPIASLNSEATGEQGDTAPPPIAALTPTPSSHLGPVNTSPALFFLPFFPLLLLIYFGLRLS
jgi:hypothetical protein